MEGKTYAERIKSILAFHSLVSGPALSDIDSEIPVEVKSLLDFQESPTAEKIARIKSILKMYGILFSYGMFITNEATNETLLELDAYLDSLNPATSPGTKRANFIPETLGSKTAAKGLCIPLFGYHRPMHVPQQKGWLLLYQSIEASETASIDIFTCDQKDRISYYRLGIEFESSTSSRSLRIAKRGHDPLVTLMPPFPKTGYRHFVNDYYETYVAGGMVKRKQTGSEKYDPLEYRYSYYFISDDDSQRRMRIFVADLLRVVYYYPAEDSVKIAEAFIDNL